MLIEFASKDPRRGMRVNLEDGVARALIESGSAKEVKAGTDSDSSASADSESKPAPIIKKPAKNPKAK